MSLTKVAAKSFRVFVTEHFHMGDQEPRVLWDTSRTKSLLMSKQLSQYGDVLRLNLSMFYDSILMRVRYEDKESAASCVEGLKSSAYYWGCSVWYVHQGWTSELSTGVWWGPLANLAFSGCRGRKGQTEYAAVE